MANPSDFTLATALEMCTEYPEDSCSICLESLSSSAGPDAGGATDNEVVRPFICNDHYFHRICLRSYLISTTPPINTLPLDREIIFGNVPNPQVRASRVRALVVAGVRDTYTHTTHTTRIITSEEYVQILVFVIILLAAYRLWGLARQMNIFAAVQIVLASMSVELGESVAVGLA